MTLFEYLAVSFSIVLSFAVVRILNGLPEVFSRGRVDWVHAAWVIHQLIFLAFVWWNVWSYQAASWNFLTFLAVLAAVSIVYYQAAVLIPAQPTDVISWRSHFEAIRPLYFGAMIAWALVVAFNNSYLLNIPVIHPTRVSQFVVLLVGTVGVSTRRHQVHALLVAIIFVFWPLRIWILLAPGALAAR
jgi:hypothetical protein